MCTYNQIPAIVKLSLKKPRDWRNKATKMCAIMYTDSMASGSRGGLYKFVGMTNLNSQCVAETILINECLCCYHRLLVCGCYNTHEKLTPLKVDAAKKIMKICVDVRRTLFTNNSYLRWLSMQYAHEDDLSSDHLECIALKEKKKNCVGVV